MTNGSFSLRSKLILTLFLLLSANGAFFVGLSIMSARYHLQLAEQNLNRDLAERLLKDAWLSDIPSKVAASPMGFERVMALNPDIEIYVTDPAGQILGYSAPEGHVVRERISLEPVEAFLDGNRPLPIFGDDPRDLTGHKVFSAAPVRHGEQLTGYLYVILGGETYDNVMAMLRGDYVLRLTMGLGTAGFILIALVGLWVSLVLTKRVRGLADAMKQFRQDDFSEVPATVFGRSSRVRDEIDDLGESFHEMADRIRTQIRMLEAADRARREMIANTSHDLRTPLATLHGFLETLIMKEAELSENKRRRYLALSLEYSERLRRLITDLFELSTLDMPDPRFEMELFSIAEIAQDVAEKFELEAERKGINFLSDVAPHAPFVLGDVGLIERALEKLLENALAYTPAGGRVFVEVTSAPEGVAVRVEDSGPGIDPEDLGRIFDRYYRGSAARSRGEGAGLGLAIARRIVELHGGRIFSEGRSRGAAFVFTLPAAPD